jgi:SAM-dependent methyltransferase
MSSSSVKVVCPLCSSHANWFCDYFKDVVDFFKCDNCLSIFKSSLSFPNYSLEKTRYETHNNDVHDKRYQKFVIPITQAIEQEFHINSTGLDYGCGTGPVATFVLEGKGYKIRLYDPFFYPDESYKKESYDFIICCEVMEHFFDPNMEFIKLKNLLKPNSKLYCKTKMISDTINIQDFKSWHYKDDPTHVFFYTPKSLQVICEISDFKSVNFDDNLIIFST